MDFIGKNVEEAVQKGLEELGLKREDVEIEVLDKGREGLFGLGSRQAKVKIVPKEDHFLYKAKEIVEGVLRLMGLNAKVEVEHRGRPYLNIIGEDTSLLIGKRGRTLDALQFIINLILARKGERRKVLLDSKGYRGQRKETLERLALKAAEEVRSKRRKVTLEPMNSWERRIIHTILQNYEDVMTQSTGESGKRRVVVVPKDAR